MALTKRQIALFEAYSPEWTDVKVRVQQEEVPSIEQVMQTLDGNVSKDLKFSTWLEVQPVAYQRRIFGTGPVADAKYDAWRNGDLIVTKLPPQAPISMVTLQRRNGAPDPKVISNAPLLDPQGLPRRVAARVRSNAADAPEFNGNKLISPSDIPSFNFDALSSFLTSLTPTEIQKVLPKTVLKNWTQNPTAAGLRYDNNKRVSFQLVIKRLEALSDDG